jgi:branched chain amino acid efflux pump
MTDAWIAVAAVGVATVAIKGIGPVLLGGRELPPRALAVVRLLAPAVLAGLVLTQVFGGDRELVVDERALGLLAALVAVVLRAPILVVVIAAAATTALVRLATG